MALEGTPGWHRLPNGVAAYSDSVEHWKARPTLMKVPGQEGVWGQVKNAEDIYTMENAFRSLTPSHDSQRIMTFLSPSKFLDFYEQNSDVPVAPYPRVGCEQG